MKGRINKIFENRSREGQTYWAILIGDERYTVWDPLVRQGLREGAVVEYESKEIGDYKRIVAATLLQNDVTGMTSNDTRMVRMGCLKYATTILSETELDSGQRAERVLDIARSFERYVTSDPPGGSRAEEPAKDAAQEESR